MTEGAAVAGQLDPQLDRLRRVASTQEVGVQRVDRAGGLDGPTRRHRRLSRHQATEDVAGLDSHSGLLSDKDAPTHRFDVEQRDDLGQWARHAATR
jgi:hypothetical protein